MSKKSEPVKKVIIKENDESIVSANFFVSAEGKTEFFIEVMERVRTLVEFYISLKVSAATSVYSDKRDTLDPDVKFELMLLGREDIQYFDNILPNVPYSDQDFLSKAMEKLAEYVFIIITKSDTVFDDLLKLLVCTQGVLISDTMICINGEPVGDDFTQQAPAPRNATLN